MHDVSKCVAMFMFMDPMVSFLTWLLLLPLIMYPIKTINAGVVPHQV